MDKGKSPLINNDDNFLINLMFIILLWVQEVKGVGGGGVAIITCRYGQLVIGEGGTGRGGVQYSKRQPNGIKQHPGPRKVREKHH